MECADFRAHFLLFLRKWVEDGGGTAEDEELEDALPEAYARFLDTPAPWLHGEKPGEYFLSFGDPALLTGWMTEYLRRGMKAPDPLLERIRDLGEAAAPSLCAILDADTAGREEKLLAMELLRDMGSLLPLSRYVAWQRQRSLCDELCDGAVESLELMGEAAVPEMLLALEGATDAGKEALLSLLSRWPGDGRTFDALMALFDACPDRQAVLASYLGRLGDARALPALCRRALDEGVGYLDYIELRNAIERLGGEAPPRRFHGDAEYEALFGGEA